MSEAYAPAWQAPLSPAALAKLGQLLEFPLEAAAPPADLPQPVARSAAELINQAVAGKFGLVQVSLAARPYPLWLRAGTDDAASCLAALPAHARGLRIPYAARRILEIGAGAGYRSVGLAIAFPGAEILTTESDPGCNAVNALNTLPYRNITSLPVAVSATASRYGFTCRVDGAGRIALARDPQGPINAMPLAVLLRQQNWRSFDTIVITPDAASASLQTGNFPPFVRMIALFTGGHALNEEIAAQFEESLFLRRDQGDYALFYRREVKAETLPALPVMLLDPEGSAVDWALANVTAAPWGFFMIGAHGFRLHPNNGTDPLPRLSLTTHCQNFSAITALLRVGNPASEPIRFKIFFGPAGDAAQPILEQIVFGGKEQQITAKLPPTAGPCQVAFTTEMADPAAPISNAWAEILDPAFI